MCSVSELEGHEVVVAVVHVSYPFLIGKTEFGGMFSHKGIFLVDESCCRCSVKCRSWRFDMAFRAQQDARGGCSPDANASLSHDTMADELDWLEMLVASERIQDWLQTVCSTQASLLSRYECRGRKGLLAIHADHTFLR